VTDFEATDTSRVIGNEQTGRQTSEQLRTSALYSTFVVGGRRQGRDSDK
jgi:hypothetical protein